MGPEGHSWVLVQWAAASGPPLPAPSASPATSARSFSLSRDEFIFTVFLLLGI